MKSALTIGYNDLISQQKGAVMLLKERKARMIKESWPNLDGINRRIAIAERILVLLQKSDKNPQMDLFALNDTLNKSQ